MLDLELLEIRTWDLKHNARQNKVRLVYFIEMYSCVAIETKNHWISVEVLISMRKRMLRLLVVCFDFALIGRILRQHKRVKSMLRCVTIVNGMFI